MAGFAIDCAVIDEEGSDLTWNAIDPTLIARRNRLFLDLDRIDPPLAAFRMKHLGNCSVVRVNAANAIMSHSFKGALMEPIDEFRH
jgi:hypothetical protein